MARLASETIFSGKDAVIPMDDVAWIRRDHRKDSKLFAGAITVILKCSKWNQESQEFEPSVYLVPDEAAKFMRDWCFFRGEVDPVRSGAPEGTEPGSAE